jgi:hypothetical protein|nr:MAG TPA: hypothetical protein [Caudoviricetes sp.]
METKDLRYTPAEYTREHQRTYTVLDIREGDSSIVVVSPAMQYSDALRAYDITTADSTLITDAVSKWILTGEAIWDTLEHLRLQIRTVDSQRIALPDGFVGRVLIARVTPDANAEAPELIRLGALLHRIQQEPTAAVVYQHKVKPFMPNQPIDPNSGIFNKALFYPIRALQFPRELVRMRTTAKDDQRYSHSDVYTLEELKTFWTAYEQAQAHIDKLMPVIREHPNYSSAEAPDMFDQTGRLPALIYLNPIPDLALEVAASRNYTYPKVFWRDITPAPEYEKDACKEISYNELSNVPNTLTELNDYMGRYTTYLKVPFAVVDGVQYYFFFRRTDVSSNPGSYIGTDYGNGGVPVLDKYICHSCTFEADSDLPKDARTHYDDSTGEPYGYTEGATINVQESNYGITSILPKANFKDLVLCVHRSAQLKLPRAASAITVPSYVWDNGVRSTEKVTESYPADISVSAYAGAGVLVSPERALEKLSIRVREQTPTDEGFMRVQAYTGGHGFKYFDSMSEGHKTQQVPALHIKHWDMQYLTTVNIANANSQGFSTAILPEEVMRTAYVHAHVYEGGHHLPTDHTSPALETFLKRVGIEGYREDEDRSTSYMAHVERATFNDTWVINELIVDTRNLWHLKGIYEKWQQLRKASEHSTRDSLSSS